MKLLIHALTKFTCGLLLVGLLIFLPAGTLRYPNGWLLIGLLFVPMLIAGFVMLFKAPGLLAKRLDVKEKQGTQKGVVAFSGLMFLVGFVVAGLDFRFSWSQMPLPVTVAASALFLIIYLTDITFDKIIIAKVIAICSAGCGIFLVCPDYLKTRLLKAHTDATNTGE